MRADDPNAVPLRRVFVMYRKAWWRFSPEEWWQFVATRSTTKGTVFPNENLIGRPRAVNRVEDESGEVRYEPAEPSVWVRTIDAWDEAAWAHAADELEALGMTDPRRESSPWPAGGQRRSIETPVYGIEAYGSGKPLPPERPDDR